MRYEEEPTFVHSEHGLESFLALMVSYLSSQLLSKPKFSSVEKIKTIGSTYMAATGLTHTPVGDENKVQSDRHTHTRVSMYK